MVWHERGMARSEEKAGQTAAVTKAQCQLEDGSVSDIM